MIARWTRRRASSNPPISKGRRQKSASVGIAGGPERSARVTPHGLSFSACSTSTVASRSSMGVLLHLRHSYSICEFCLSGNDREVRCNMTPQTYRTYRMHIPAAPSETRSFSDFALLRCNPCTADLEVNWTQKSNVSVYSSSQITVRRAVEFFHAFVDWFSQPVNVMAAAT